MHASRCSAWGLRQDSPFTLTPVVRMGLAIVGMILLGLLATAATLKPAERGYGTHQQLGLPPCTFQSLAGLRCPSCGMTTAWAHLMRGHVIQAAASNAGGLALGFVALAMGPWTLLSGIRGRWIGGRPSDVLAVTVTASLVAITMIDWAVRLFLMG